MEYIVLTQKEHYENWDITNGTSKKGDLLNISMKELIETLGYPTDDDNIDDKVHAEWVILFSDGDVATIHDWYGIKKDWTIGGHNGDVVDKVKSIFKNKQHVLVEQFFIGKKYWAYDKWKDTYNKYKENRQ